MLNHKSVPSKSGASNGQGLLEGAAVITPADAAESFSRRRVAIGVA